MWSDVSPLELSPKIRTSPDRLPTRRCRSRGWQVETERETRYLDEDGDGVLDAVVVIEELVATAPDRRVVLCRRRVVLHEVDDAGLARSVTVDDV